VVPLDAVGSYASIDAHSIIVHVVPHQLDAAVVQADGQHRAVGLGEATAAIIPLNAHDMAMSCSAYEHVRNTPAVSAAAWMGFRKLHHSWTSQLYVCIRAKQLLLN
jgi:hypothetical protein